MQRFERWQPVEVLYDGETWIPGLYEAPYDDKETPLAHTALVFICDETTPCRLCDDSIRPVPRFEAVGDDLRLIDAALTVRLHDLTRADYEGGREVTDATLKVKELRDRVRAAMEAGR